MSCACFAAAASARSSNSGRCRRDVAVLQFKRYSVSRGGRTSESSASSTVPPALTDCGGFTCIENSSCSTAQHQQVLLVSPTVHLKSLIPLNLFQHPIPIILTQDVSCNLPERVTDAPCRDGKNSRISVSSCTKDLSSFAVSAFGKENPIIALETCDMHCYIAEYITVYLADDECHTDSDGITSFKATFYAIDKTAALTTYSDTSCSIVAVDTNLNERSIVTLGISLTIVAFKNSRCSGSAFVTVVERSMITASKTGDCDGIYKNFVLMNVPNLYRTVAVYEDSTCSGTPSMLTFTQVLECDVSSEIHMPCRPISHSHFVKSTCTDDYNAFTASVFGSENQIAIEKGFTTRECSDPEFVVVYSTDGSCHTNLSDRTSYKATIDSDGTLVLMTFVGEDCSDTSVSTTLSSKELESSLCLPRYCSFTSFLCLHEQCSYYDLLPQQ
ncbi:unnamed protein product [Phytophthora lilii]|uniref:Unnamed protein product n=1 Tax=Phytophthora lilii TaxID=2077276 RepID=A0A9W6TMP4_9STRA|nr:unnamed protein product [Phytophthora lilii]